MKFCKLFHVSSFRYLNRYFQNGYIFASSDSLTTFRTLSTSSLPGVLNSIISNPADSTQSDRASKDNRFILFIGLMLGAFSPRTWYSNPLPLAVVNNNKPPGRQHLLAAANSSPGLNILSRHSNAVIKFTLP